MRIHIEANKADPNAPQGDRLEQEGSIATRITHLSHQLTRATEFIFHDISGDNLHVCMPKHIKEFTTHYVDTRVAEGTLRNFANSVTTRTIQNARDLVKHLVLLHGSTASFKAAMRAQHEDDRILFWGRLITPAMHYFLHKEQFKAISFDYIFHDGTRPDPAEERLRQNLRLHTRFVSATLLYSTYVHRIQMSSVTPNVNRDEVPGSNDAVVVNYKASVGRGPLTLIPKRLGNLPAAREFLTVKHHSKLH